MVCGCSLENPDPETLKKFGRGGRSFLAAAEKLLVATTRDSTCFAYPKQAPCPSLDWLIFAVCGLMGAWLLFHNLFFASVTEQRYLYPFYNEFQLRVNA